MTRDGDGDYWQREDARRAQLDRAFWRDYERRRERAEGENEAHRREQETSDGQRTVTDGDTAEGPSGGSEPGTAINYLQSGPVIGYRMSMPWTDPPSPLDATLSERPVEISVRRRRLRTRWWSPWRALWRLRTPTSRPRGSTTTP